MREQRTTIPAHQYLHASQSDQTAPSTSLCALLPPRPSYCPQPVLRPPKARFAALEMCPVL